MPPPEIIIFGNNSIVNEKISGRNNLEQLKEFKNNNEDFLVATQLLNTVWNKTYKREFLIKNNILFNENFKAGEDGIFNMFCIFNNPKITAVDQLLYNYQIFREGSSTSLLNILKIDIDALKFILDSESFLKQSIKTKQIVVQKYVNNILFWYKHCKFGNKSDKTKKIKFVYELLSSKINSEILKECISYLELKQLITPEKFIDKVFSIKHCYVNMKKRKILTILGLKLKLKG